MAYQSSHTGQEIDDAIDKSQLTPKLAGEKANYAALPHTHTGGTSGDVWLVTGATSGYPAGFYRCNGSAYVYQGPTISDEIDDSSSSNKFVTSTQITKLTNIEENANVTDADNVSSAGAPIISSGSGAPSGSPTKVGDIYIDTTGDNAYIAVGTSSSSDWEVSNDGAGSGSTNLSWTAASSTVASSTGTNAVITAADSSNAGLMSSADKIKFDAIEPLSDKTDTANVTDAGALMDSEVDADIKTLSLPASTTISTFGATIIDDANAAAARTTLGVDAAGADNSTNVTLTGSGSYLSIAGQAITVDPITESDISDLGTYLTAEADTLDAVTGRGATTTNGVTVGSIDINGEIIEKVYTNASVTSSFTLEAANGTIQNLTLTGNVTTVTDSLADGEAITLVVDDGSGKTITWGTSVDKWVGGSQPTLDTTNKNIIVLWKVGSDLYGMTSGVAS
jgi:hypothetical protein